MSSVLVQILRTEGCGCAPPTLAAVKEVADELGLAIVLEEIIIHSSPEAVQYRFLGSPTIRINGQDLEPAARNQANYGLG